MVYCEQPHPSLESQCYPLCSLSEAVGRDLGLGHPGP